MYKLLTALLALQILVLAAYHDAIADPAPQVIVSPDGALRAIIIPVVHPKISTESRVEFRKSDGTLLWTKDYSSPHGDQGYGVGMAQWTPDSQYFVYTIWSTGGHQPYSAPTFFYSRQNDRVRDIETPNNLPVLDQTPAPAFKIVAPHSVAVAIWAPDSSPKGFDSGKHIIILVDLETGASPHPAPGLGGNAK